MKNKIIEIAKELARLSALLDGESAVSAEYSTMDRLYDELGRMCYAVEIKRLVIGMQHLVASDEGEKALAESLEHYYGHSGVFVARQLLASGWKNKRYHDEEATT